MTPSLPGPGGPCDGREWANRVQTRTRRCRRRARELIAGRWYCHRCAAAVQTPRSQRDLADEDEETLMDEWHPGHPSNHDTD